MCELNRVIAFATGALIGALILVAALIWPNLIGLWMLIYLLLFVGFANNYKDDHGRE